MTILCATRAIILREIKVTCYFRSNFYPTVISTLILFLDVAFELIEEIISVHNVRFQRN